MRLLFFEMRKSWLKISVIITAAVFCMLNVCKLNEVYRIKGRFGCDDIDGIKNAYFEIYGEVSGEITDEKIGYVLENLKWLRSEAESGNYSTEYDPDRLTGYAYGDYSLFNSYVKPELEYAVTYPNTVARIVQREKENIDFFRSRGNIREAEKSRYFYNLYKDRQIKNYNLTEWTRVYFGYDFSSLLIQVMLIIGLSGSFSEERESGMSAVIRSSGMGAKTALFKVLSAGVFSFCLTVIFTAVDFFTVKHFCGIDGLLNPVYSSAEFAYSPYRFSLLGAMIFCALLKFLAFAAMGEIFLITSAAVKNTVISVCVNFGICVGLIILSGKTDSLFNPVNLLTGEKIINGTECFMLLGKPLLSVYPAIIGCVVFIISAALAAVFISRFSGGQNYVSVRIKKTAE